MRVRRRTVVPASCGVSSRARASEHGHLGVVALEEELVRLAVDEVVHEHRAGFAVTAGAANLLVVALDAAGEREMEHRSHVGFVDAHAERDGGDDDVEVAVEERGLRLFTRLVRQTRVVRRDAQAAREDFGGGFGALAGGGVDDGGRAALLEQPLERAFRPLLRQHLERFDGEVVTAKAVNELAGAGAKADCLTMSRWTSGVAVAVSAIAGAGRSEGSRSPSRR